MTKDAIDSKFHCNRADMTQGSRSRLKFGTSADLALGHVYPFFRVGPAGSLTF
jgi:hypothetical protein